MAVPIRFSSDGKTVEPGTALSLFTTNLGRNYLYRHRYMVLANGQSFVMNSFVPDAHVSPIAVVLNWKPKR